MIKLYLPSVIYQIQQIKWLEKLPCTGQTTLPIIISDLFKQLSLNKCGQYNIHSLVLI